MRATSGRATVARSAIRHGQVYIRGMIYTFKVHAPAAEEPLETTHCAHGSDVLGHAKALIEKYPDCSGVEVLMLGSRLFFMPPTSAGNSQTA